jgi:uncharacterized membrane protein YbhN (UPF0104 family)
MRRFPAKAGVILKVVFGLGVFAWMASSGKLNLAQVVRSLSHWPTMLTIIALGYAQAGIIAWRWKLLLHTQDILIDFSRAWGLTMIGMLFNVVIPGSVGGDLIKGYYISRAAAGRTSPAAASIMVDRVVGLIGLLFLGAVMAVAQLQETLHSAATRSLGMLTTGGVVVGLLGVYVAVFAGGYLSHWRFLPSVLQRLFRALYEYRKKASVIPIALMLSVFNQILTCGMYYLALRTTGMPAMPIGQFFMIVPLGMVTCAIPISPGGIGVGQAAFFALFRAVAPAYALAGTDAFTVFQMMFILVCLSGFYWYVSYQRLELETGAKPVFTTTRS